MADRAAARSETRSSPTAEYTFDWHWGPATVPVGYDLTGPAAAQPVLLLPALSTVSTRDELQALAQGLPDRRIVRADWPGFGDRARPRLDYDANLCRRFLEDLVAHLRAELGVERFPVVACGHSAGFAIDLAAAHPGAFSRLVLIAPTWRGPLPTMMNGRRPVHGRIRRLIHAPVIGEALYRLNVSRPVVRMMYRRHVFTDPASLTDDLLGERMRLTRQPGARFASACFVTGALDPFANRDAFLAAARRIEAPTLVLYGRDTPPKSRAEMDALANLPNVEHRLLEHGALGMAEECAADLAPLVEGFLARSSGRPPDRAGHDTEPQPRGAAASS